MSRAQLEIENSKPFITPQMACTICDALSYMVDLYAEYYIVDDEPEEKSADLTSARAYYNAFALMKEYTRNEFFDHRKRYERMQERQREVLLRLYEERP